jgi:hypothetical protein
MPASTGSKNVVARTGRESSSSHWVQQELQTASWETYASANCLCRAAHTVAKQILNQAYEAVGVEGLKAENHIQALIGGIGIG